MKDLCAGFLRGASRVGEQSWDVELLNRQLLHEVKNGGADVGGLALALVGDKEQAGTVG